MLEELELDNFRVYLDKNNKKEIFLRFTADNYEPSFTASREEVEKLVKYLQAYLEEKKKLVS